MRETASGHEIKSEIIDCIDLGSLLLSWVTAGHEIDSVPYSF